MRKPKPDDVALPAEEIPSDTELIEFILGYVPAPCSSDYGECPFPEGYTCPWTKMIYRPNQHKDCWQQVWRDNK